jgi:hypothetical protein
MSRPAVCVLFVLAAIPLSAHAVEPQQQAVGNWSGALHQGENAYRVNFHVHATPDGRLTGTVSGLPGDGAAPVPAAVEASGDTLEIVAAGGRYSGVWDQARAAWVGSWKQADLSEPLALRWDADNAMRVTRPSARSIVTLTAQPPAPPAAVSGGGGAPIVPPSAR